MRKFALATCFFLVLFLPVLFSSAQTEVSYPPIPGVISPQEIRQEVQTEAEVLPLFTAYLFRFLLIISFFAIVGIIMYAGGLYLLSSGNPIKTKIAREWILSAIQGSLIIFTSYALLFALDSHFVLFRLRDLEETRRIEMIDLEWEIRNVYYQIPFGLLIEDAILNDTARNKLYDVLDATNRAEAAADAIAAGSRQLMAIIELCPQGRPCCAEAPISSPQTPFREPEDEDRLSPPEEDPYLDPDEANFEDTPNDTTLGPATYIDEEGNEWLYDPQTEDIYLYDPQSDTWERTDPPEGHLWYEESSFRNKQQKIGFFPGIILEQKTSVFNIFSKHNLSALNFLSSLFSSFGRGLEVIASENNYLHPYQNISERYLRQSDQTAEEIGESVRRIPGHWHISRDYQDEDLALPDEDIPDEEDVLDEEVLDEEDMPEEDEEDDPALLCPSCPDIAPAVQAKIAEIQGYMNMLEERLEALLETKEPIKEDLYQLYKAVMLKSLGHRHLSDYNSLLLERRYYEREEIIVETDRTKTEIGPYSWDWQQWVYNILYQIEIDGEVIEENDPFTFYLRRPEANDVIHDASMLASSAREDGIQDAGRGVGVPRRFAPPPPDIGTSLYSPVNPASSRITSPFGMRYDPFTGDWVMHNGIDFGAPRNTPVYASEKGEVVFSGWSGNETDGYGKLVAIYHRPHEDNDLNRDVVTYYAHLEAGSLLVEVGDAVTRGQQIAGVGTTGRSTGYHLHYETRVNVSYPFLMHTGSPVDPAPYIDAGRWSFFSPSDSFSYENSSDNARSYLLRDLLSILCISGVSAKTDLEILNDYLLEHGISPQDLSREELNEILEELGIEPGDIEYFDAREIEVRTPSDYLTCGMEIPVGETFELTWEHLVDLLDTIDYYVSEGRRLIEQQARMNALAAPCSCPCVDPCCDCDPPECGACELTCNLGAIRAAHADVLRTRALMRRIAAHIRLLTYGHFNTPTEDVCHPLNEDIRDEEEKILCQRGGSKLITKHELITRKLNYSRTEFDECMTRPEHLEDVLEGRRTGKMSFFGPLVEELNLPRYTKTKIDDMVVNTSDLNWFCCTDSRLIDDD